MVLNEVIPTMQHLLTTSVQTFVIQIEIGPNFQINEKSNKILTI